MSRMENEYMALMSPAKEAILLHRLLSFLQFNVNAALLIKTDWDSVEILRSLEYKEDNECYSKKDCHKCDGYLK